MVKNLHFHLIGSWTGWSFFFQVLEAVFTVYLLIGYEDQWYHSNFNSSVFLLYLIVYLCRLKAFRIFFSLVFGNFLRVCLYWSSFIQCIGYLVSSFYWRLVSINSGNFFISLILSFIFSVLSESSQLSLYLLSLLFTFLCPFRSIFKNFLEIFLISYTCFIAFRFSFMDTIYIF